ncbi:hypothetical protein SCA31_22025 [Chryseobacterium sp. SIMBA_028]
MWVSCKITSNNFLLYNKFKEFINQTPFFILEEESSDSEENQVIFWDIDSINIDTDHFRERVDNGCLIIIISSLLSKDMISNLFEHDHLLKIGTLSKNVLYPQFVEEISRVIDDKNRVLNP